MEDGGVKDGCEVPTLLCLAMASVSPAHQTNGLLYHVYDSTNTRLRKQQSSSSSHSAFWQSLRDGLCCSRQLDTSQLLSESLQAAVSRISSQRARLYKHRKRKGGQEKLEKLLSAQFSFPLRRSAPKRKRPSSAFPTASAEPGTPPTKAAKFEEEVKVLTHEKMLSDYHRMRAELARLRQDFQTLAKKNRTLTKQNEHLQSQNKKLKAKVAKFCPKRANQKVSYFRNTTLNWREKYLTMIREVERRRKAQGTCTLENLQQERNNLKKEKQNMRENQRKKRYRRKKELQELKEAKLQVKESEVLQKTVKTLHDKFQDARDAELLYETEVNLMKEDQLTSAECAAPILIQTRHGNRFSAPMRHVVYKCIASQVPVSRVASVVEYIVRTLTPHQLDDLPSVTTVCRNVREMGVLSDLQAGKVLLNSKNSTLAWDATSLDGKHLNEMHIATKDDGTLVLGVSHLPDGRAVTYQESILEVLGDTLETYSQYYGMAKDVLEATAKANVTNTLGDRVATNHAVVRLLSEGYFGKSLNELNCNVHPLDTVASSARETLRKTGTASCTFGNEGAATNVIKAVSKMRYKAGRGDPVGFRHMLATRKIPAKTLPRYVGNRLHILFHLAGVVYSLKDVFADYLRHVCPVSWRLALLRDLENGPILLQLQILGIFGKVFTGPWMEAFYGNKTGESHLGMRCHMHKTVDSLAEIQANPRTLLTRQTDVFGNPLAPDDTVLSTLRKSTSGTDEMFNEITSHLAEAFLGVLNRQLKRYLTGDLSQPSEELLDQTASAPVHNIFSEETLGMVDSLIRRAPNASTSYVESKVKFAKNKTLAWLQGESDADKMVVYAATRARELSKLAKERALRIEAAMTKRSQEVKQKRDKTQRNKVESKVRPLLGKTLTREKFTELFPHTAEDIIDTVLPIIQAPVNIVNSYLLHTWTDEEGTDICYEGLVQKLKRGGTVYKISYWKLDEETIDDCIDFEVQVKQVITDILYKELEFV